MAFWSQNTYRTHELVLSNDTCLTHSLAHSRSQSFACFRKLERNNACLVHSLTRHDSLTHFTFLLFFMNVGGKDTCLTHPLTSSRWFGTFDGPTHVSLTHSLSHYCIFFGLLVGTIQASLAHSLTHSLTSLVFVRHISNVFLLRRRGLHSVEGLLEGMDQEDEEEEEGGDAEAVAGGGGGGSPGVGVAGGDGGQGQTVTVELTEEEDAAVQNVRVKYGSNCFLVVLELLVAPRFTVIGSAVVADCGGFCSGGAEWRLLGVCVRYGSPGSSSGPALALGQFAERAAQGSPHDLALQQYQQVGAFSPTPLLPTLQLPVVLARTFYRSIRSCWSSSRGLP